MPALPTVDPDPTTRIALPVPATTELDGDATQVVKAPEESRSSEERGTSPGAFDRSSAESRSSEERGTSPAAFDRSSAESRSSEERGTSPAAFDRSSAESPDEQAE
jgi:hypothetical protein